MIACILCQRELSATDSPALFIHEPVEDCLVRVADGFGISLDDEFEVDSEGTIYFRQTEPEEEGPAIVVEQFALIDPTLRQIFAEAGLTRLGGQSSGAGWSYISLFQKCPHAWKRRYVDPPSPTPSLEGDPIDLAIGSLVHTYLAVYYQQMIVPGYPLTPEMINQRVRELGVNPDVFTESWRLFTGYRLFYQNEEIQPLAVEYEARNPRNNDSCRYDLIAFFPKERPGMLPGTYIVEHKSTKAFSQVALSWENDGEVIGQVKLWQELRLEKKFGPLRGVIVNLLGKQKVAEFHRTIVAPSTWQVEQHAHDLRRWNALIALSRATNSFPRSRNSCKAYFGLCQHYADCHSGEKDGGHG